MSAFNTMKKGHDEYFTPRHIWEPLGRFDLDPCAHTSGYPHIAENYYSVGGLERDWFGRVRLNPPYGRETRKWLERLSQHNNGVALTFARTETSMFFDFVWPVACAILFLKGRVVFEKLDGTKYSANAGAPSILIAYGMKNAWILKDSDIPGKFVWLRNSAVK